MFLARRGDHDNALKSIEMARALGNKSMELNNLSGVLKKGEKNPVDIAEFLPGRWGDRKSSPGDIADTL
jgi:hypothetical protein